MSNPGPENFQPQIGGYVYSLITRQDPDKVKDSYLCAIGNALAQPDTVTKIRKARLLSGGWESWAQVECAIALQDLLPNSTIAREEPIYNNSVDRVDLWATGGGVPPVAVEMKCRNVNFGSEAALTGLPGQMVADMLKIKNQTKPGLDPNRVMYAIGITGNPYDLVWQRKDASGTVGDSIWSSTDKTFGAKLRWCYLQKGTIQLSQSERSVEADLAAIKEVGEWKNLYMVWYKLP